MPRLIFSSTAAVYGESEDVPVPETSPTLPTNPYGASKLAVDLMIGAAAAGTRESVKVFGTDYPTRDGTAIRDYIHVEDLARPHLLALEAVDAGEHEIYNLGNGTGYSVREVVETAHRVTGRPIEAVESPRRHPVVASSDRIRAELGWNPEKPELEAMISDAWEWMQTHSDGYE